MENDGINAMCFGLSLSLFRRNANLESNQLRMVRYMSRPQSKYPADIHRHKSIQMNHGTIECTAVTSFVAANTFKDSSPVTFR